MTGVSGPGGLRWQDVLEPSSDLARALRAMVLSDLQDSDSAIAEALKAAYASRHGLMAVLRQTQAQAIPPVPAVVPTVTFGTIAPSGQTQIGWADTRIRKSGLLADPAATGNAVNLLTDSTGGQHFYYVEFDYDGAALTFYLSSQSVGYWGDWLFVDGAPVTAAPAEPTGADATSAGQATFMTVTWASRAVRRVRLYFVRARLGTVYIGNTEALSATPKPQVTAALVSDSFIGSTELNGIGAALSLLTGWDVYNCAQGGTGYANAGSASVFGSTARLNQLVQVAPDIVVVVGSVNDDSLTATVGAAASSFYGALSQQLPGVPVLVVGPQTTSSATTWTANRIANRDAVKAAALAAPNVVGFVDPIGPGVTYPVPAWAISTAYTVGQIVLWKGAAYKCMVAHTSSGSAANGPTVDNTRWTLLSWLTGTGNAGTPTADGNRDVYLQSDATHPTPPGVNGWGGLFWATRIYQGIEDLLTA